MNTKILRELKCWMSWMTYMDSFFPGSFDPITSLMAILDIPETLQLYREMEFLPLSCIDPCGEILQCLQAAVDLLSDEERKADQEKLLVLFDTV